MKYQEFVAIVREEIAPFSNGHRPVEKVKELAESLGVPVETSTDGNGWQFAGPGPACRGFRFEDKFLRFDLQNAWKF